MASAVPSSDVLPGPPPRATLVDTFGNTDMSPVPGMQGTPEEVAEAQAYLATKQMDLGQVVARFNEARAKGEASLGNYVALAQNSDSDPETVAEAHRELTADNADTERQREMVEHLTVTTEKAKQMVMRLRHMLVQKTRDSVFADELERQRTLYERHSTPVGVPRPAPGIHSSAPDTVRRTLQLDTPGGAGGPSAPSLAASVRQPVTYKEARSCARRYRLAGLPIQDFPGALRIALQEENTAELTHRLDPSTRTDAEYAKLVEADQELKQFQAELNTKFAQADLFTKYLTQSPVSGNYTAEEANFPKLAFLNMWDEAVNYLQKYSYIFQAMLTIRPWDAIDAGLFKSDAFQSVRAFLYRYLDRKFARNCSARTALEEHRHTEDGLSVLESLKLRFKYTDEEEREAFTHDIKKEPLSITRSIISQLSERKTLFIDLLRIHVMAGLNICDAPKEASVVLAIAKRIKDAFQYVQPMSLNVDMLSFFGDLSNSTRQNNSMFQTFTGLSDFFHSNEELIRISTLVAGAQSRPGLRLASANDDTEPVSFNQDKEPYSSGLLDEERPSPYESLLALQKGSRPKGGKKGSGKDRGRSGNFRQGHWLGKGMAGNHPSGSVPPGGRPSIGNSSGGYTAGYRSPWKSSGPQSRGYSSPPPTGRDTSWQSKGRSSSMERPPSKYPKYRDVDHWEKSIGNQKWQKAVNTIHEPGFLTKEAKVLAQRSRVSEWDKKNFNGEPCRACTANGIHHQYCRHPMSECPAPALVQREILRVAESARGDYPEILGQTDPPEDIGYTRDFDVSTDGWEYQDNASTGQSSIYDHKNKVRYVAVPDDSYETEVEDAYVAALQEETPDNSEVFVDFHGATYGRGLAVKAVSQVPVLDGTVHGEAEGPATACGLVVEASSLCHTKALSSAVTLTTPSVPMEDHPVLQHTEYAALQPPNGPAFTTVTRPTQVPRHTQMGRLSELASRPPGKALRMSDVGRGVLAATAVSADDTAEVNMSDPLIQEMSGGLQQS